MVESESAAADRPSSSDSEPDEAEEQRSKDAKYQKDLRDSCQRLALTAGRERAAAARQAARLAADRADRIARLPALRRELRRQQMRAQNAVKADWRRRLRRRRGKWD